MSGNTLLQIHHQFKDGHTEMVGQNTISNSTEMRAWEKEIAESHPLPEGAQWFICNEKDEHFVMAVDPGGVLKGAQE